MMQPKQFVDQAGTRYAIDGGLRGLVEVQGEVSAMVADALPTKNDIPPINILTYGFAIMKEITELMDELGWKPWKPRKPIDRERVADEFADILAFLGLLTIYVMRLTGLTTTELAAAYLRKSDVNVARFNGEVPDYVLFAEAAKGK